MPKIVKKEIPKRARGICFLITLFVDGGSKNLEKHTRPSGLPGFSMKSRNTITIECVSITLQKLVNQTVRENAWVTVFLLTILQRLGTCVFIVLSETFSQKESSVTFLRCTSPPLAAP